MTDQVAAVPTNIGEIVKKYVELRDTKDRIAADAKAKTDPISVAMKTIETYLMKLSQDTGQTQFGTEFGTAFVTTKKGCNVTDWDATVEYIRTNGAFNLLNKAVNKTAVDEYIEKHGMPPPGVNWVVMKDIQIRRPN